MDGTVADRITDDVAVVAGSAVAPSAVSRDGTIAVGVETAGVLVTALHAPEAEQTVRSILKSARPTPGGSPAPVPHRSGAGIAAVTTPQPGTFLGKGFDACTAPPQSTMDTTSVRAAQALGIPAGSAIYSDIEAYTSTASCRASVLSYLSGWTEALHGLGYLSGFYSTCTPGPRCSRSGTRRRCRTDRPDPRSGGCSAR